MNKNVCFLVRKGRIYVSLRSISECIDVPVNTLRGLLYEEDIHKTECICANDTLYLTEEGACELLTVLDEYICTDRIRVDRFHTWMHDTFSGISVEESAPEDPPADEPEDDSDDCPICSLFDEIIGILKLQKQRMDRLEEKLEAKA